MNKASLIGVRAALASYAAFALVACGGGGGYVAPAPPPPSVPLPAATYTVGGMVSGLEGSGLVLANGSDNLPISANGAFAFATEIAAGTAYNVTSAKQPADPSQTCVVTNGSGKVGATNVTNVSVVCTTGVANANLNGTFKMARYSFVPNGIGDVGDLVSVTFDGAGKFSGTGVHNYGGRLSSDSVSGTYTIAADGTLDITLPGDISLPASTMTGWLSANGKTFVASQTSPSFHPSVLLGIKQGQSNFSNADLIGIYKVVSFSSHSSSIILVTPAICRPSLSTVRATLVGPTFRTRVEQLPSPASSLEHTQSQRTAR